MLLEIEAQNLSKRFNQFIVFKDINFLLKTSNSLAVTGHNGSGKSTLLEVIAGIQRSSKGKLSYTVNNNDISILNIQEYIGFSSLKINPYDELSGLENIQFVSRHKKDIENKAEQMLKMVNLYSDRNKRVKYYSSGMKHRLRFILSILHNPAALFFDEPGSNLDRLGKDTIYSYIESVKKEKIIIIATNEEEEACLCDERITLGQ